MNIRKAKRIFLTTLKYLSYAGLLILFAGAVSCGQYVAGFYGGILGFCLYWFAIILFACFMAARAYHKDEN